MKNGKSVPFQRLRTTPSFTPSSTASALEGAERPARCATQESLPEGDLENVLSGAGRSRVSLQIVPVRVRGGEDSPEIKTYAFLDNGSDTTLCLSSLGKPGHFSLSSINAENIAKSGFEVSLNAFALDGNDPILLDRVWTVDRLSICVPSGEDVSQWPYLKGVKFPRLDSEEEIVGILIGNDVPEAYWVYDERCGRRKQPYAVRTPLCWTLIRRLNSS